MAEKRHATVRVDTKFIWGLIPAMGVSVRKNSVDPTVGPRNRINVIEGSNVTLTVGDDAGNNEVDVTIAAAGGVAVRANSGVATTARPQLNFIEGNGIDISVADDAGTPEVDVTVTADLSSALRLTPVAVRMIEGTTTLGGFGGGAVVQAGTGSNVILNNIKYTRRVSSSGVGNLTAGWNNTTNTGHTWGSLPDLSTHWATAERTQDLQNTRIVVGVGTLALSQVAGEPMNGGSGSYAGFRFSTYDGDTQFQAVMQNGASFAKVSTGITPALNTSYIFRCIVNATNDVDFYINGTLVATITSVTLPAATEISQWITGLLSTTNDGNDHALLVRFGLLASQL